MIYQPTTRETEQSTLEALVVIRFQHPAAAAEYYAMQEAEKTESVMMYLPYIEEINPFDNELAYTIGVVIGLINRETSGNVATGWLLAAGIQSRLALSEVLGVVTQLYAAAMAGEVEAGRVLLQGVADMSARLLNEKPYEIIRYRSPLAGSRWYHGMRPLGEGFSNAMCDMNIKYRWALTSATVKANRAAR